MSLYQTTSKSLLSVLDTLAQFVVLNQCNNTYRAKCTKKKAPQAVIGVEHHFDCSHIRQRKSGGAVLQVRVDRALRADDACDRKILPSISARTNHCSNTSLLQAIFQKCVKVINIARNHLLCHKWR
jgi:hypothetical protein